MNRLPVLIALLLITSLLGCRAGRTASSSVKESREAASPLIPVSGSSANLPVRAPHGMVASTDEIASRVGVEVMKRGGNAIDAAVAVALTLAVTWPSAGNIGGGGFMMIRRADGNTEIIDYRERAPLKGSRDMYVDDEGNVIKKASTVGYRAVGVPGTVAGLALALERHGKLKWADVVEPARKLAAEGFPVSYHLARSLRGSKRLLRKFPESERIFLRGRQFYEEGETFTQPDLAGTLARLKVKGPREFYEGDTARMIVDDMKSGGGLISAEDLKGYEPTIRRPLKASYRGYEILTMPPPSSGGTALIEMLNVLSHYDLAGLGQNSAAHLHLMVETMRRAFADRAAYLGDADFVEVPVTGLTSPEYANELVKGIDLERATPSAKIREGNPVAYESPETTHFTVVDAEGNVVSNTYTLNNGFGCGVTVRGAGILLNNEMDDFTSKPGVANAYGLIQRENNSIEPRKRPLSAMTPTIVLKEGKLWFAVGSPGGPTIINTVLQVISNVIDFKMNLKQAIDAPRVHHQWMPDEVRWEPYGLNADTYAALEKRGQILAKRPRYMGDAEGIMIDPETGIRLGASDPRLGGVPVGY